MTACSPKDEPAAFPQSPNPDTTSPVARAEPVPPTGARQAGVTSPALPQANLLVAVYDVTAEPGTLLADLGRTIVRLVRGENAHLVGIDPADLTVTVGVGPRLVAEVDNTLPGAEKMPTFNLEDIPAGADAGDLLLQICATDPLLLSLALQGLAAAGGDRLVLRWQQRASRGPYQAISVGAAAPRNVLGFVDGIVGPRTDAEMDSEVWLSGPASVADGTIMCVRRMNIDTRTFAEKPVAEQEAVIGRTREASAPLSGGSIDTTIDFEAKTPAGRYLVPVNSHARRANPLAAGVGSMLRRSYSTDFPEPGLVFISFQNQLRTFTQTMARMQDGDDLLELTTTTATGTFLILPGFDESRELGSSLFGGSR